MFDDWSLDKEFDEEIDLTPLIDVVFILLIFFFITSTFIRPTLPIDLPTAESAIASMDRKETLAITIDSQGSLFCEGAALLREDIGALLKAHPEKPIQLMVDQAAPFDAFLVVVDKARLLGREDLSVTTLPAGRE
jgi:biopolymer transport protein ExbD